MIGIQNDGSNISIGGESSNSAAVLVDEQPRKQPKVVVNGVAITVAEPETHCDIYKRAYVCWGVGTVASALSSLICGVPLCVYIPDTLGIGFGVSAGAAACGSLISAVGAVEVAHKINQEKGLDTAITGGILDFAEAAALVAIETNEAIRRNNES